MCGRFECIQAEWNEATTGHTPAKKKQNRSVGVVTHSSQEYSPGTGGGGGGGSYPIMAVMKHTIQVTLLTDL